MPLTSFDDRTARAVVAVLQRAGIAADARSDGHGESEVVVPEGTRDEAMRILGSRMEEVREAAASADADHRRATPSQPAADPDDVHAGPPLVMERLRSMAWLAVVFLVPLLAVTIAGPLRGELRIVIALALMVVVGVLVWRRRQP